MLLDELTGLQLIPDTDKTDHTAMEETVEVALYLVGRKKNKELSFCRAYTAIRYYSLKQYDHS